MIVDSTDTYYRLWHIYVYLYLQIIIYFHTYIEGDQNTIPQQRPLWRKDCSELEATEEKLSKQRLSSLRELTQGEVPFVKLSPSPVPGKRTTLNLM